MAVIWRFRDGKVGHERQTAGLIKALQSRGQLDVHEVLASKKNPYWCWLRKSFPANYTQPDLIVGAGSACQAPMLAAQRTHGGKTIYLMRPKFPLRLFDLCIIPSHDAPPGRRNVLQSEGVLNDLTPSTESKTGQDVILIGGPSKHHSWNEELLVSQINRLIERHKQRFILSTSRRTPIGTVKLLEQIPGLDYQPFDQLEPTWLTDTLGQANSVWVTADSISMMYEVLTVGANLGILEVPVSRNDRISRVAQNLLSKAYATSFLQWEKTGVVKTSPQLNEASRLAGLIEQHFQEILR